MEECKYSHNEPEVNVAQYFVIDNIRSIECKNKAAHSSIFYQSSFAVHLTDFLSEVLWLKFLLWQAFDKVSSRN